MPKIKAIIELKRKILWHSTKNKLFKRFFATLREWWSIVGRTGNMGWKFDLILSIKWVLNREERKACAAQYWQNFPSRRSLTWLVLCHFETNIFSATSQESRPESLFYSHSRCQTRPAVWFGLTSLKIVKRQHAMRFLSFLSLYFTHSTQLVSSFEIYVNSTNNQPQTSSSSPFPSSIWRFNKRFKRLFNWDWLEVK